MPRQNRCLIHVFLASSSGCFHPKKWIELLLVFFPRRMKAREFMGGARLINCFGQQFSCATMTGMLIKKMGVTSVLDFG